MRSFAIEYSLLVRADLGLMNCRNSCAAGGFGSFLLGLNKRTYEMAGKETEGNVPGSYKEPGIGWMTGFLFAVSFVGIVALIPLRKVGELSSLICSRELRHYLPTQSCSFPIVARQMLILG